MSRVGDPIRQRIAQIKAGASVVAALAAPRIQRKFRRDATTKRGNVPSYGSRGDVPIVAEPRVEAIIVTSPDWCLDKAEKLGQTEEWMNIVAEEAAKAIG